ncbi:hypothetical protein B0H10DRAFT_2220938 [Mycena sp. CBHHK59/15]|nr:hypothetical protein B0H10DRAFT_2220938 [Mycena sp. CBHHK59/15]
MALPIQQLALHVQNTTTHLQLASASLNLLAAAPPPALGGTPQWALDMQHEQKWEFYVMKVLLHNSTVAQHEHAEWSLARVLNSSSAHDNEPLTPLCTPFPRLPVPVIPPPPGPGAAANPPPAFAPGPIIVPAAHVLFH